MRMKLQLLIPFVAVLLLSACGTAEPGATIPATGAPVAKAAATASPTAEGQPAVTPTPMATPGTAPTPHHASVTNVNSAANIDSEAERYLNPGAHC